MWLGIRPWGRSSRAEHCTRHSIWRPPRGFLLPLVWCGCRPVLSYRLIFISTEYLWVYRTDQRELIVKFPLVFIYHSIYTISKQYIPHCLPHALRDKKKGICRDDIYLSYEGRTDDVMKLLMIGFEGLFHFCNPSNHKGWHAIGGQSWSRFLDLTDEYPDQTSAAIFQYSKKR